MERIDEQLELVLDQELLAEVISFRQKRLEKLSDVLGKMMGMFSTSFASKTVPEVVSVGVEHLREMIEQADGQKLISLILNNIHNVAKEMPEHIKLSQISPQYEEPEDDSWSVKTGKAGKRLFGEAGQRQIPLQKLTAYHLLDEEPLFISWVDEDERMLMRIFLELEQTLAGEIPDGKKSSSSGLQQLLKVLLNQVEERKNVLEGELAEAGSKLKAAIVDAISKTGTLERRAGFYSEKRLNHKEARTKKRLNEYINEWQMVNMCLLNKAANMHQFLSFCADIEIVSRTFEDELTAYFNALLIEPLQRLKEKLGSTRQQMEWHRDISPEEINNYKTRLTQYIEEQILGPLNKSLEEQELNHIIEGFSERLTQASDKINEKALFITKLKTEENPPELKSREIEWRLLVRRGIKEQMLSGLTQENDDLNEPLHKLHREIGEIEGIIDTNIEAAAKVSADPTSKEDPLEIVDDALERTGNKLEKVLQQITQTQEKLVQPVEESQEAFATNMMDLLYRSDVNALSVLDAKYKVNEKTQTWRTKSRSHWTRAKHKLSVLMRFTSIKAKQYGKKGSIFLGLKKEEVEEKKKADIAAFLIETERRINELPYIYRQLFSVKTVSELRFYVGVNENFATVRQAYTRWTEGHRVACAILGEKGSGKSTYINLVREELFAEADVWQIDLNQTCWTEAALLELFKEWVNQNDIQSVDDLILFLNDREKRTVILFEGIQNLYLRHLNGYEGIEQLMYLISETNENIFWVASCSSYAWSFLDEVTDISKYFTQVVRADALDEKQIENVILNRHRTSGYELTFEPEEAYAKSKKYRGMKEDEDKIQEHLKDKYFKELTELSEGNASIAMIFWVRSIRDFDDTHLYIAPLEAASLKMLDDLQPATLFVFAALVLHDTLSPGELSSIMGMEEKESKLIFNRLKMKGILVATENGMSLNQLMYRQTIRELKERNILHLE